MVVNMQTSLQIIFFFFLTCLSLVAFAADTTPGQIHLAFPGQANQITVTWMTNDSLTRPPLIEYSPLSNPTNFSNVVNARTKSFMQWNDLSDRTQYIHWETLTSLLPNTIYQYRVGNDVDGWSGSYTFKTSLPAAGQQTKALNFLVYGDLGLTNAQTLPFLQKEVASGHYDMILHVGDIAYDMDDNDGKVGDAFFQQVQSVAANIPYQVCPGNHEHEAVDTFHNYKERFMMPQWSNGENMYYSYDVGSIHFIAISTEDYFDGVEVAAVGGMYDWLVADLQAAQKNRAQVPWIIVYGHRPLYCSNTGDPPKHREYTKNAEHRRSLRQNFTPKSEKEKNLVEALESASLRKRQNTYADCSWQADILRNGFNVLGMYWYPLETLFWQYGVDLYICGHEHSYERTFPVYSEEVYNGTTGAYINPRATVHLIDGAAGNDEELGIFSGAGGPWSAFRSATYGYARMTVFNETMLYWEQIGKQENGEWDVEDSFLMIQNSHGPFGSL